MASKPSQPAKLTEQPHLWKGEGALGPNPRCLPYLYHLPPSLFLPLYLPQPGLALACGHRTQLRFFFWAMKKNVGRGEIVSHGGSLKKRGGGGCAPPLAGNVVTEEKCIMV